MSWHLFVIDNSHRFVLHAWRYLSQNIGVGIGEQSKRWISPWTELSTDCGVGSLWWIPADHRDRVDDAREKTFSDEAGRQKLYEILQHDVDKGGIFFIIDADQGGAGRTSLEAIHREVRELVGRAGKELTQVLFVSAHSAGHRKQIPVHPKARETFRDLRRELGVEAYREKFDEPKDTMHILVTGAGFEIRGEYGGFGLPPTPDLLYGMGHPFTRNSASDNSLIRLGKGSGYPVPVFGSCDRENRERLERIEESAENGDLDQYWNNLLHMGIDNMLKSLATTQGDERDHVMAESIQQERRMREAFRQSLLRYDWGHMKQSIFAARLPWHAWLTTNYTHFANRAIDLVEATRSAENGARRSWRIIATASEARSAEQALVASRNRDRQPARRPDQQPARHLFKLHGDLGDLHTMAIAGFDKEIFSPLGVKVESLGQIYANAENFLLRSLPHDTHLVWHIVGHSLNDMRLCQLIASVGGLRFQAGGERKNLFIFVAPQTSAKVAEPRKKLLERISPATGQEVREVDSTALGYMARLSLEPILSFEELLERLAEGGACRLLPGQFRSLPL